MSRPARRRLARTRTALTDAGRPFGDWLGVVIRVHLIASLDGVDPPPGGG